MRLSLSEMICVSVRGVLWVGGEEGRGEVSITPVDCILTPGRGLLNGEDDPCFSIWWRQGGGAVGDSGVKGLQLPGQGLCHFRHHRVIRAAAIHCFLMLVLLLLFLLLLPSSSSPSSFFFFLPSSSFFFFLLFLPPIAVIILHRKKSTLFCFERRLVYAVFVLLICVGVCERVGVSFSFTLKAVW